MRRSSSTIWMVAQREFLDQFRDWRIVVPMFVLVTLFPFIADDTTRQAVNFMNRFGGDLILDHLIPFVVLVIGFFPLSFTLVVALESFVGEKERGTIERSPAKQEWTEACDNRGDKHKVHAEVEYGIEETACGACVPLKFFPFMFQTLMKMPALHYGACSR